MQGFKMTDRKYGYMLDSTWPKTSEETVGRINQKLEAHIKMCFYWPLGGYGSNPCRNPSGCGVSFVIWICIILNLSTKIKMADVKKIPKSVRKTLSTVLLLLFRHTRLQTRWCPRTKIVKNVSRISKRHQAEIKSTVYIPLRAWAQKSDK